MKTENKPCTTCPSPCKDKNYNPYNKDCDIWSNPEPYIAKWVKTIKKKKNERIPKLQSA